ncbi:MAG: hypothetical protein AB7F59_03590 [Bdellovibrionales bacterium]
MSTISKNLPAKTTITKDTLSKKPEEKATYKKAGATAGKEANSTKAKAPKMSASEEMAMFKAAIVDIDKPVKDDPALANMASPTYSPKELRAKAAIFMASSKATPEEKALLASTLKEKKVEK